MALNKVIENKAREHKLEINEKEKINLGIKQIQNFMSQTCSHVVPMDNKCALRFLENTTTTSYL